MYKIKNSLNGYGCLSILLHWLTALSVLSLFPIGLYMMSLGYYDPLYNALPNIHKSWGFCLFLLIVFRIIWRSCNPKPLANPAHTRWEQISAHAVHMLLYILMLILFISGYLISTADGQPLYLFSEHLQIPASIISIPNQEELFGNIHLYTAITLVVLAILHGLAAIKHHFIDKDHTLIKMLKPTQD